MWAALVLPAALALEGPQEIRLGQVFTLGTAGAARYTPARFRLEFLRVTNDSRCPVGVDCVWAGDATVIIRVGREEIGLHTGLAPREAVRRGFRVTLVGLSPERGADGPVRASFKLERK